MATAVLAIALGCSSIELADPVDASVEELTVVVPPRVGIGATTPIECVGGELYGVGLDYVWSTSSGTIDGRGPRVSWTPIAAAEADVSFTCTIYDGDAALATAEAFTQVISRLDALAAYYPFDGNTLDESGNEHIGATEGATLGEDRLGRANSAYAFDGAGFIRVSGLNFDFESVTLSFFVSVDDIGTEPMSLLSYGPPGGPPVVELAAFPFPPDEWRPRWYQQSAGAEVFRQDLNHRPLGTWLHVLWMYTGRELVLVVDGATVWSWDDLDPPTTSAASMLRIGAGDRAGFVGKIDDVRVYEDALWDRDAIGAVYGTPR